MDSITLSTNEFRALASENRTGIIKLLQGRNHTLSELSKKMGLSAPTVKQHLAILETAGLVKGLDEGRKWKYYCLTRKGKNIFSNDEGTNILIVLCVTVIALGLVLFTMFSSSVLVTTAGRAISEDQFTKTVAAGAPSITEAIDGNMFAALSLTDFPMIFVYITAAVLLSVFAGYLVARYRKTR